MGDSGMIGKEIEKLEKENKFCWYVEFKPKKMFGFDLEEHNKLMNAFIGFLPKDNIKILRLNDEIVEDVFELNYDEIYEAFIPVKFELHNEGEFVATDVIVDIEFPNGLTLIESLPSKNSFIVPTYFPHNRNSGRLFSKKNHLRLWSNKSQPPYSIGFEEVYVFSDKVKKFKIKYEIHSDELGSKGIKGELIIDAQPIKDIRKYTMKRELDRDAHEYNAIVKSKLNEIENEN